MKRVFKCAREDDKKIQECQTLKLGDAPMHLQEIFKKTQASKLRDAPVHPLLHQHYQFVFRSTIFLSLHVLCAMLGASCFQFYFQFFIMSRNPAFLYVGEKHAPPLPRTLHRIFMSIYAVCVLCLLIATIVLCSQYSCLSFQELLFSWLLELSLITMLTLLREFASVALVNMSMIKMLRA